MNIFYHKKRKKILILVVFLIIAVFLSFFLMFRLTFFGKERVSPPKEKENGSPSQEKTSEQKKKGGEFSHPLNGASVHKNEFLPPIAAVIDNHPSARPVYGLDKAGVVFESEVEGGFSRYLAIFDAENAPERIGPIRSARPYMIDWAAGVSSIFVHCGGSPQALARLAAPEMTNLNEFYNAGYFWREEDLPRPHNIFISSENLNSFTQQNKIGKRKKQEFQSWDFKATSATSATPHKNIIVDFGRPSQKAEWEYQENEDHYLRYLDDRKHLTGEKKEIRAANVIIQFTPAKVKDDKLRLKMESLGEGEAIICTSGQCLAGRWEKGSPEDRIKYYIDEEEASLRPGTTWIEVVRPTRNINIENYDG